MATKLKTTPGELVLLLLTMEGKRPLLCHNDRLANPFDPHTVAVKEAHAEYKKQKTEAALLELCKCEWLGGLYYEDGRTGPDGKKLGPYIPSRNIVGCLIEAAKKYKLGKKMGPALVVEETEIPIQYQGPRDALELWDHERFRSMEPLPLNGSIRVLRTRPMFREWRLSVPLTLDTELIDYSQFHDIVKQAGAYIGLGDSRPEYGLFEWNLERRS